MSKRVALYLRVSTSDQTVDNQRQALVEVAEAAGWEITNIYTDEGVSGSKGRDSRPAFNELCEAIDAYDAITPEMIEAGIQAMWGYQIFRDGHGGIDETEWRSAMREGFLAMCEMQNADTMDSLRPKARTEGLLMNLARLIDQRMPAKQLTVDMMNTDERGNFVSPPPPPTMEEIMAEGLDTGEPSTVKSTTPTCESIGGEEND